MKLINILINGYKGRMGSETVKAIEKDENFKIVAKIDKDDNLISSIINSKAQVVVDFTNPGCVYENTRCIIQQGACPVIGTSGLKNEEINKLMRISKEKKRGGIIAPNFAIGAILMMKFASAAAKHFSDVEIIELHHNRKIDFPSGTSVKTANLIKNSRLNQSNENKLKETFSQTRGTEVDGVKIHSVRLEGLIAHQEVIFGGYGQSLIIRHDSFNRESFMPGVCLACKKVLELNQLVYGLENII